MPIPAVPCLRSLGVAALLATLAACGPAQPPPAAPALLTKEQAAARTVVPLTRPVALDKAGRIAEVEFELPPPDQGATTTLMLGLRVQGGTAKAMLATKDLITAGDLPARLHLQRIEGAAATDVALMRTERNLRDDVPVGPDGQVPFTTTQGADSAMLIGAGLFDPDVVYGALNFAHVPNAAPGRYRLTVDLTADRPDLHGRDAELLVGYSKAVK